MADVDESRAVVPAASSKPSARTRPAGCGAPDETTIDTAVSGGTRVDGRFVLATGLWLMTRPRATVALDAVVTAPSVSPPLTIAVVAAACVRPTTFGTGMFATPSEIASAIAVPG